MGLANRKNNNLFSPFILYSLFSIFYLPVKQLLIKSFFLFYLTVQHTHTQANPLKNASLGWAAGKGRAEKKSMVIITKHRQLRQLKALNPVIIIIISSSRGSSRSRSRKRRPETKIRAKNAIHRQIERGEACNGGY